MHLRAFIFSIRYTSLALSFFLSVFTPASRAVELLPPKVTEPLIWKGQESAPLPTKPYRIGFWNIRWFPGHHPIQQTDESRQKQIAAVSDQLRAWQPTIFFAAEIRSLESLKQLDVPHPFRACTDIPRTAEENPALPQQGMAILSMVDWEAIWVLDFSELPESEDRPSRGILAAQFKVDDQLLTCYVVHLKSNRGGPETSMIRRQKAIEYLQWDWKRQGIDPARDAIMVLGDFNTSPTDPAFSAETTLTRLVELGFHHAGEGLPRSQRITLPKTRYPENDFDHIYLSAGLWNRIGGEDSPRMEVKPVGSDISDHHALFFDMTRHFMP